MTTNRTQAAFALAAAAIFCWSSTAARAQEGGAARGAMTVSYLEGSATSTQPGGSARPLATGAALHEGDVVETAPDGRVEISLASGTLLRLGESSRLVLHEAAPGGGKFRARLALGNLWARVHKLLAGDRFEVETENAVAGVRGTEFLVEAGGDKGADLVRVYEGEVVCRGRAAGGWSAALAPGRELQIERGRAPGSGTAFAPTSDAKHPFMRWVRGRASGAEPPTRPSDAPPAERKGELKPEHKDGAKEERGAGGKDDAAAKDEKDGDGKADKGGKGEKKGKDDEKREKRRRLRRQ